MSITKKQITEIVKRVLSEENERWNGQDIKAADMIVQALSKVPYPKQATNDKTVHDMYDQISSIRMKLMEYIRSKTGGQYVSKGSNSWKLVKKK